MALKAYEDILMIQTAFIGDVLLSIPLIKKTRELWPQARISLLVRKGLGDFVMRSGLVDHVYEVDKSDPRAWRETSEQLRARKWGLVISPHQSLRTLFLIRSLRAERKVGYRSFLSPFVFNSTVARPMALPEALRQLSLLIEFDQALRLLFAPGGGVGRKTGLSKMTSLAPVPRHAEMSLLHFLDARVRWQDQTSAEGLSAKVQALALREKLAGARLALLAPGSVWNTKRWTPEGYAQLATTLLADGFKVLLIGAENEKSLCETVAAAAPGSVVVAGELTLWESAELMALAELVVANDSGAMHLASVSDAPTVAVFGPTVLAQGYRPWQTRARVVETALACRPCGKHGGDVCPIGTHACMKDISAVAVMRAATDLLGPK